MSEIPLCSIAISAQVSPEDTASLENSLRMAGINVQKPTHRVMGADDLVLLATVVSGAAAVAQLADYSIKLAKAINRWRRKMREKGQEIEAKLQHPERPSLDLKESSDQEVEAWLSPQNME